MSRLLTTIVQIVLVTVSLRLGYMAYKDFKENGFF